MINVNIASMLAGTLVDTHITPSLTVTHSPVMVGGVNVAAAVAKPVVRVLLLVIGVVGWLGL